MKKVIKFFDIEKQGNVKDLIPVHINIMRDDNYYWYWSDKYKDWIRRNKISEKLKRLYKIPVIKGCYK